MNGIDAEMMEKYVKQYQNNIKTILKGEKNHLKPLQSPRIVSKLYSIVVNGFSSSVAFRGYKYCQGLHDWFLRNLIFVVLEVAGV